MAKMRYKIFLAVSLTILVSEAIFVMINYLSDKEALQTALAQKGQQSQKTFEVALSTTLDSMSQLATFVANSPDVQRLMDEAERSTTENSGGNVMKPEKFGDNMDNLRHLVVDVNRDGQPRQGFELGRVYAGLRGVVPVFSFSAPKNKKINDNWGHQAGDRVLAKLGRIMMEHARNYDVVGRYGGEEFAILIPGANEKMGYQIAEKLRVRVAEEIKIPGSPESTITISVGVAGYRKGYRQEDWFAAADTALYAAKRAGRNRVFVSEADGGD